MMPYSSYFSSAPYSFFSNQSGLGQGFQNQNPHFNPAFFGGGGNDSGAWNPHGVKRTRQE